MAESNRQIPNPNLEGLRIGPNGRPLTNSGLEFSPITPARPRLPDDDESMTAEQEEALRAERVEASFAEYMHQFARNKEDEDRCDEAQDNDMASGSGSYAAAAATPPARPFWIFQTTYAKQPINTATYVALRAYLKKTLVATHCSAENYGMTNAEINFTPLDFDQNQRGFPLLLTNDVSVDWVRKILTTCKINDADYRLWLPGEEPKDYLMSIYLNSDFDGIDQALLLRTIKQVLFTNNFHFVTPVVNPTFKLVLTPHTQLSKWSIIYVNLSAIFPPHHTLYHTFHHTFYHTFYHTYHHTLHHPSPRLTIFYFIIHRATDLLLLSKKFFNTCSKLST
jgi:hypothetical protein